MCDGAPYSPGSSGLDMTVTMPYCAREEWKTDDRHVVRLICDQATACDRMRNGPTTAKSPADMTWLHCNSLPVDGDGLTGVLAGSCRSDSIIVPSGPVTDGSNATGPAKAQAAMEGTMVARSFSHQSSMEQRPLIRQAQRTRSYKEV
jgi:hypothetical protein